MSWDDPFAWLVAAVLVLIAAKWLVMSTIDVRDRWGQTRTFAWSPLEVDGVDEDDESDVLDTIHCRIDDVGERVDRLESRLVDLEAARAACDRRQEARSS